MLFSIHATQSQVRNEWQQSAKSTPAVSFLSLPKELRDIIYHHISEDIYRVGVPWDFLPRSLSPKLPHSSSASRYQQSIPMPSDVAIMRTCRQVYSEFAKVLYATPMEFRILVPGSYYTYYLPMSSQYAHLVKKVSVVIPRNWDPQPATRWHLALQIGNGLATTFSSLKTLRVGWPTLTPDYNPRQPQLQPAWSLAEEQLWNIFEGRAKRSHQSQVYAVERFIRGQRERESCELDIPHHFELLQVLGTGATQRIETPFSEAVKNLRQKSPDEN